MPTGPYESIICLNQKRFKKPTGFWILGAEYFNFLMIDNNNT